MSLRRVELICPNQRVKDIQYTLKQYPIKSLGVGASSRRLKTIVFFAESSTTKTLSALFEQRLRDVPEFIMVISEIEATIPSIEKELAPPKEESNPKQGFSPTSLIRVPLQEIYGKVTSGVAISPNYYILFVLSAIVAAIWLLYDNVAIVIWSMLIAPFLWPNLGIALGTTLGDFDLIKKSLHLLGRWTIIVLVISRSRGMILGDVSELLKFVSLSYSLIIVACISGVAAILSLMRGESSTLVGVMVATALLPPLVLAGLLLWWGHTLASIQSFILFLANVVGLNIAGVTLFMLAGIRPAKRWEAKKAKKQTHIAVGLRTGLLLLITVLIFLLQR